MFDISGMVQHIRGGVGIPQEQSNDKTDWKFNHVAIGVAVQQKTEGIPTKFGERAPPARNGRTGQGGWWNRLINHAADMLL